MRRKQVELESQSAKHTLFSLREHDLQCVTVCDRTLSLITTTVWVSNVPFNSPVMPFVGDGEMAQGNKESQVIRETETAIPIAGDAFI